LTEIHTTLLSLCRFQGAREAVPHRRKTAVHIGTRSFKTE